VTLLDGLVARSAFNHSVNYRSVVVHATAAVVQDPQEKTAALAALVEAVAPGRTGGTRPPSRSELAATTVLRLDLHEVSVKVRTGPPDDDLEDLGLPYWAGVLPLITSPGTPQPNDDLPDGVAVSKHVSAWKRPAPLDVPKADPCDCCAWQGLRMLRLVACRTGAGGQVSTTCTTWLWACRM
jgi:hypothetical protein